MNGGFSDLGVSLEAMGFGQLLLAFTALISYVIAQGRLLGSRGRRWAWAMTLASVGGFCSLGSDWTSAAILSAFSLVGLGLFAGLVWLMSALMGLLRGSAEPLDGQAVAVEADSTQPVVNDALHGSSGRSRPLGST